MTWVRWSRSAVLVYYTCIVVCESMEKKQFMTHEPFNNLSCLNMLARVVGWGGGVLAMMVRDWSSIAQVIWVWFPKTPRSDDELLTPPPQKICIGVVRYARSDRWMSHTFERDDGLSY